MFEVNTGSTAYLLDYARRAGASRFLYGSTGSVFLGSTATGLTEELALHPSEFFPVSKLCGELLAEAYRPHFPVSVLRFFTPYGPKQVGRLVPDLIDRVRSGRPITLPPEGDGMTFTTIYYADAVTIIGQAIRESWDETINVSNPEIVSIRTAAETIGRVVNKRPIFERSSTANAARLVPELSRLGDKLALGKLIGFEDGIRSLLASAHA